jgi:gephyrin
VQVFGRPTVAILSTGNEITYVSENPPKNTVFDTNRPALHTALTSAGYKVHDLHIAPDELQATLDALKRGADHAEVIIVTGGTSMGELDLLKPVIERYLNGEIHFGRVAMKPG